MKYDILPKPKSQGGEGLWKQTTKHLPDVGLSSQLDLDLDLDPLQLDVGPSS